MRLVNPIRSLTRRSPQRWSVKAWRSLRFWLLLLMTLALAITGLPTRAAVVAEQSLSSTLAASIPVIAQSAYDAPLQLAQAQQRYEAGQLTDAVAELEQTIRRAQQTQDRRGEAIAWRNLALVYQQLGQLDQAEAAIVRSLEQLELVAGSGELLRASALDLAGSIALAQGQAQQALDQWEAAQAIYQQAKSTDPNAIANTSESVAFKLAQNQLNQAQALQQLGLYRQSVNLLAAIATSPNANPDSDPSLLQTIALRRLGDAYQRTGDITTAKTTLEQSLSAAQRLGNAEAIAAAHISLGNLARSVNQTEPALAFYDAAASTTAPETIQLQARLNRLSLSVEPSSDQAPSASASAELSAIRALLQSAPANRQTLTAQLSFAQQLLRLAQAGRSDLLDESAERIAQAIELSQTLKDRRSEAYARGLLGRLYEQTGQLDFAQQLTEQALLLAQQRKAPEIAYSLDWQLGRIFRAQAEQTSAETEEAAYEQAVLAYDAAIEILQDLRTDLAAVSTDVQANFRDSIEPIHREFVDLLLVQGDKADSKPERLEKARKVIESLQLAELDNFFREACLTAQPVAIDQIDQRAAVIYPILLSDRIETIVSLPGGQLKRYSQPIPQSQVISRARNLRRRLVAPVGQLYRNSSQQLYDWLIRPLETDLAEQSIETLVFVLDGELKNIPMGALSDGTQFLIEKYAIALTPGLQLLEPRPLKEQRLEALTAGLSEARQGFSPLPFVISEVEQIQDNLPTQVLLNQEFQLSALEETLNRSDSPILHFATHGQFSSEQDETFLLAWDERISINDLSRLLKTSELNQDSAIELLVLSACQTATGDGRAPLGLAGFAVRSGARSTVASLWLIDDEATSGLMETFYRELSQGKGTRADALRRAQLATLNNPQFRHPYYWSAFVLLGNWL